MNNEIKREVRAALDAIRDQIDKAPTDDSLFLAFGVLTFALRVLKRDHPKAKRANECQPTGNALSIDPSLHYTLDGFFSAAGIGRTTLKRALDAGIVFPSEKVGRRKYIRGDRGIAFLQQIAAISGGAAR